VELLIQADPECVHAVNKSKWTAVHQAAHAGEEGVIEVLLDAKVPIDQHIKHKMI
jgi:ankyrin repeat protein